MQQQPKNPVWKPPDPRQVKTNFDGAIFEDLQEAGIGVIIRNSKGEVLAALSKRIPTPSSVVILESFAARRAVQFIHEIGLRSSIFNCDSTTSISALRGRTLLHSSSSHLIKDILSLASSSQSFSFSHTYRQGNALVDAFAKRARRFSLVWMESILLNLYNCYLSDFQFMK